MSTVTRIGLDLAKNVFQVHGVDEAGKAVLRKTLRRGQVAEFFVQLPSCLVGMESCSTSQYWARKLVGLGHQCRLIPPQFVKPYVKSNKNDANDAEAICEAVGRPHMRFVSPKTPEQQSILAVHRVREGWVKGRTACANQIRALMAEFGLVLPPGIGQVSRNAAEQVNRASSEMPLLIRDLVFKLLEHLRYLEHRIGELELIIEAWHRNNADSRRLAEIPGVGMITATALVATIGDARQFKSGRQLAAGSVSSRDSTPLGVRTGF